MRRWWRNPWLRAAVVHPIVFVAPWVAASFVMAARPNSDIGDVSFGFVLIPLGALASFLVTVVTLGRRQTGGRGHSAAVVLVGLLASAAAFVLGMSAWFAAAEVACHGHYECPF